MAFTLSLWRPMRSKMRVTSSPGSTTRASRVTGSPMMEQLHCSRPTGMVMWIKPSVAALSVGRASLMHGSIASEMNDFAGGAACPAAHFDRLDAGKMEGHVEMASPGTALNTPLAATHLGAGARMGVWFGCALPDDFGDAAAEYRAARQGVALIDKNYRAYLGFTGPDRVRYLNAILTNNIKDLPAGQGNVSLLLNPQGHILAEIETYALADNLFCVPYAMIRERLIANHGVRHAKEFVRKGVRFNFRKDVPLRIQQQRNVALSCGKILDVVRQNGVQVAHSVGPGESEVGAVVLVNQRDALACMAILSRRVPKIIGQGASEPHAHPGARTQVRCGQRSIQRCAGRSHFHVSFHFSSIQSIKVRRGACSAASKVVHFRCYTSVHERRSAHTQCRHRWFRSEEHTSEL